MFIQRVEEFMNQFSLIITLLYFERLTNKNVTRAQVQIGHTSVLLFFFFLTNPTFLHTLQCGWSRNEIWYS